MSIRPEPGGRVKTESDWVKVLAKIDLFAGLPDKALKKIAKQVKEFNFPDGVTILGPVGHRLRGAAQRTVGSA